MDIYLSMQSSAELIPQIVVRDNALKNTGAINEGISEVYNNEHEEKIEKFLKYIKLENKLKNIRVKMYAEMRKNFPEDIKILEEKYPEMFI